MRTAREFAVYQSFVKPDGIGSAARMRRIGCDLNGVFVTLMMVLQNERRNLSLLNKTLGSATTQVNYAR
jgi:hypothetical protein